MRELTKEEILNLEDEYDLNIIGEYTYEHFIKENNIKFYEPDENLDKNKFIKIVVEIIIIIIIIFSSAKRFLIPIDKVGID